MARRPVRKLSLGEGGRQHREEARPDQGAIAWRHPVRIVGPPGRCLRDQRGPPPAGHVPEGAQPPQTAHPHRRQRQERAHGTGRQTRCAQGFFCRRPAGARRHPLSGTPAGRFETDETGWLISATDRTKQDGKRDRLRSILDISSSYVRAKVAVGPTPTDTQLLMVIAGSSDSERELTMKASVIDLLSTALATRREVEVSYDSSSRITLVEMQRA